MTFQQLEYVITVAENRSFSKAAKALFIAQPSLSQYIKNIEENLGTKLFDRSVNPVRLTYAGEIYVENAKKILELKLDMDRKIADITNLKEGTLRVGATAFRTMGFVSEVLGKFQKKFPGIKIEVMEGPRVYLESECVKGNIDLFIATLPVTEKNFDYDILMEEKIMLAVPEHYSVNKYIGEMNLNMKSALKKVSLELFKNEPFVLLRPEQNLHRLAVKLCKKAGFSPKITLENGAMESALQMVSGGMGITFASDAVMNKRESGRNIVWYSIDDDEARRYIAVVYKKNKEISGAAREFLSIMKATI